MLGGGSPKGGAYFGGKLKGPSILQVDGEVGGFDLQHVCCAGWNGQSGVVLVVLSCCCLPCCRPQTKCTRIIHSGALPVGQGSGWVAAGGGGWCWWLLCLLLLLCSHSMCLLLNDWAKPDGMSTAMLELPTKWASIALLVIDLLPMLLCPPCTCGNMLQDGLLCCGELFESVGEGL